MRNSLADEKISAIAERRISEMRTFRMISHRFLGVQAAQEFVKEAILFVSISCVAAWSVSVMVHQLITMMIRAPASGWW
jgi:hypothetical protein